MTASDLKTGEQFFLVGHCNRCVLEVVDHGALGIWVKVARSCGRDCWIQSIATASSSLDMHGGSQCFQLTRTTEVRDVFNSLLVESFRS